MTEPNDPLTSLLENENINKSVTAFVKEQMLLPDISDGSDIEIIEVNLKIRNKKKKRTKKSNSKPKFRKMKKVDPVEVEKQALDSYLDVKGLQIPIKTLLQNDDIRKQLAPYIQEEVVYPIWIESSDSEDLNEKKESSHINSAKAENKDDLAEPSQSIKKTDDAQLGVKTMKKKCNKKKLSTKKANKGVDNSVLLLPNEKKSSDEIQILDLVNSSDDETPLNKIISEANDKIALNKTKRKKKLKRSDAQVVANIISDQILQFDSQKCKNPSTDENMVIIDPLEESNDKIALSKTKRKKKLKRSDIQVDTNIISDEILQFDSLKCKNPSIDENMVIVDPLEESKKTKNSQDNPDQDLPVMDSDDWYYLNIANNPSVPYVENDILVIEKNIYPSNDLDVNQIQLKVGNKILDTSNKIDQIKEPEVSPEIAETVSKDSNEAEEPEVINEADNVITNKPKGRRRRKRKPWTARFNNNKSKLQGKIVKRRVEVTKQSDQLKESSPILENDNILNPCDNTNAKNSVGVDQNVIVKEETELPGNIANESLKNVQSTSNCNDVIKLSEIPMPTLNAVYDNLNSELRLAIKQERAAANDTSMEYESEWNKNYTENDNNFETSNSQEELENNKTIKLDEKLLPILTVSSRVMCSEKRIIRRKSRFFGACKHCGKKYERIGNLRKHEALCKNRMKTEITYECVMCPFETKNKDAFKNHLGNHILDKSKRPFRTKRERKQEEMEKKEYYVTNYIQFYCSTCNKGESTLQYRDNCKKCFSKLTYSCVMCNKFFPTYIGLRKHVAISLRFSKLKKCYMCGMDGHLSKCKFKKHQTICLMKSKIRSKCEKIPYVRLVRQELQTPPKVTPVVQTYCSKCEETKLEYEQKIKCNKCQTDLLFKCEICSEFLISRSDLRTHVFNAHIIGSYPDNKDELVNNVDDQQLNKGSDESNSLNRPPENVTQSIEKQSDKSTSENTLEQMSYKEKNTIPSNSVEKNTMENGDVLSETAATAEEVINKAPSTELITNCSEIGDSISNNEYLKMSRIKRYCSENWILRYCPNCDKMKKYIAKSNDNQKKRCKKCKIELFYQCAKCYEKFSTYRAVACHLNNWCMPIRIFQCSECPLTSTFSRKNLQINLKRRCINFDFKQYVECSKYRKTIKMLLCLKRREKDCGIAKKYQCALCSYRNSQKNKLAIYFSLYELRNKESKKMDLMH